MKGYQLDEELRWRHAQERIETAERVAAERLKGLQNQERQIKELKQELAREKAINDGLTDANQRGRKALEELKGDRIGTLNDLAASNGQIAKLKQDNADLRYRCDNQYDLIQELRKGAAEVARLTDNLEEAERRLEEAQEGAARADKTAEKLYADSLEFADLANERLMKIRKLEQQVQTQGNTIAKQADMVERMNVLLQERGRRIEALEKRAEDEAGTDITTAVATLEKVKHDLLEIYGPEDEASVASIAQGLGIAIDRAKRGMYP